MVYWDPRFSQPRSPHETHPASTALIGLEKECGSACQFGLQVSDCSERGPRKSNPHSAIPIPQSTAPPAAFCDLRLRDWCPRDVPTLPSLCRRAGYIFSSAVFAGVSFSLTLVWCRYKRTVYRSPGFPHVPTGLRALPPQRTRGGALGDGCSQGRIALPRLSGKTIAEGREARWRRNWADLRLAPEHSRAFRLREWTRPQWAGGGRSSTLSSSRSLLRNGLSAM